MAAQFQFVMRSGPTVGKVYPLEAQEISIGRDNTNIVAINDVEVSRRHARMELRGSAYVIQDLGSTNGTFVNGQRLSGIQVLNPGDTVSFGEGIMLMYEATYDPNATLVASSARAAKTMAPVRRPAPTPTPISVPAPAYSGLVPAGPVPVAAAPAKKKFPVWLIIVILLLVVICACVGFFVLIDQLNLWCRVVPFLVPMLGGVCP
jgi:predicted component of type VI protein secretion system